MSSRRIAAVVGAALLLVGTSMVAVAGVAAVYREWADLLPLLGSAGLTLMLGWELRRLGDSSELSIRESFATVAVAWITMALAGSLPYLLTGSIPALTDAVFESVSGFTATGASIVADPGELPHGILFWRSCTQWLGGMGVVMLVVALLPTAGMSPVQLGGAEAPGPSIERITPRFRETARLLWAVFVGLTATQTLLLWLADMSLFEAITHAFTTLSGGGFSTRAGSMGEFSPHAQWVTIVFMIAGGTSFALHYRGLRRPLEYGRDPEFRIYVGLLLAASLAMTVGTWGPAVHDTIRGATFTAVSIMTTTGFVTEDYSLWATPLHVVIVGLMFVGAMSGSTSGSVKVYRLDLVHRSHKAMARRLVHGRAVTPVGFGGHLVDPRAVESARTFVFLYLAAFSVGTLVLVVVAGLAGTELSLPTAVSAVASSLGNIGPGLDGVGPSTTYVALPGLGKWVLGSLMIVGRLEIIPVMILFNREAWR